jgi:hypothetical protein
MQEMFPGSPGYPERYPVNRRKVALYRRAVTAEKRPKSLIDLGLSDFGELCRIMRWWSRGHLNSRRQPAPVLNLCAAPVVTYPVSYPVAYESRLIELQGSSEVHEVGKARMSRSRSLTALAIPSGPRAGVAGGVSASTSNGQNSSRVLRAVGGATSASVSY